MRKLAYLIVAIIALGLIFVSCFSVVPPAEQGETENKRSNGCATIQDGTIYTDEDEPTLIEMGYDEFGYNYQAYMFKGRYCDQDRVIGGGSCHVDLIMKWNDAWLSNKDCGTQVERAEYTNLSTPDGKLDRHYPSDSYIGSGAWLTNHMKATEEEYDCEWDYFVKIVAKPTEDFNCASVGGEEIWGQFCVIQRIYNSNCEGDEWEGVELLVNPAGFGAWK